MGRPKNYREGRLIRVGDAGYLRRMTEAFTKEEGKKDFWQSGGLGKDELMKKYGAPDIRTLATIQAYLSDVDRGYYKWGAGLD